MSLHARPVSARGLGGVALIDFRRSLAAALPSKRLGRSSCTCPYSPDLDPIEMAFAKLKAAVRKLAARSIKALIAGIAQALTTFAPQECTNFLAAAGYCRV